MICKCRGKDSQMICLLSHHWAHYYNACNNSVMMLTMMRAIILDPVRAYSIWGPSITKTESASQTTLLSKALFLPPTFPMGHMKRSGRLFKGMHWYLSQRTEIRLWVLTPSWLALPSHVRKLLTATLHNVSITPRVYLWSSVTEGATLASDSHLWMSRSTPLNLR